MPIQTAPADKIREKCVNLSHYPLIMTKGNTTYRRRRRRKASARLSAVHPLVALAATAIVIFAAWQMTASDSSPRRSVSAHGDELAAVAMPGSIPSQMLAYTGFTVSFNHEAHQPNYVAWELTDGETDGDNARSSDFAPDPSAEGCATLADYRRSGFDRGHMIPAADVKWSAQAMTESHLLTNISPQDHRLNAGAWATLEANCRRWARRDSAIIIIAGPVLSDRMPRTIGTDNTIPVPERFFKVVLAPYSDPPRGIAFVMPNGNVSGGVQATATTIDDVELITGFDFFAALPDEIEEDVESQCEYHVWQRKKR